MNRSAACLLALAAALACAACNDDSPSTVSSDSCPTSSVFTDPPDLAVDSPCTAELGSFENATVVYELVPPVTAAYEAELLYTSGGDADLAVDVYGALTPLGSGSYQLQELLLACDDGGIGEGELCTTGTLTRDDPVFLQISDKASVGGGFTLTVTQGK